MNNKCLGLIILLMLAFDNLSIGHPKEKQNKLDMKSKISKKEALRIADEDAIKAYQDLTIYEISIELKEDEWQIDYELKNQNLRGGGPHYSISATTGKILSKKYEQ